MTDLLAARTQMGISLGFHIVFAAVGVAMPFLMMISHWRWLRTKEQVFLDLTHCWSKGVAIFFATGAVSGTVLSFELGLLWPRFMEHAGAIIGMPFSLEGTAFFLEAIALGVFLYGWKLVNPWVHWASGVVIGVSGVLSALFVVCANGWMNSPAGFDWVDGHAVNIDPWAAMFNRSALNEGVHMVIGSFVAVGFAAAGLHALGLLRNPKSLLHRKALEISIAIGAVGALLQPLQGDRLAKTVAILQPPKLAAMEGLFKTEKPADLIVGGFASVADQTVHYGLHIPRLLSFLAHGDFASEVQGLDQVPRENWPSVFVVHSAFDLMVGLGTLLAAVGVAALFFLLRRKKLFVAPWFLKVLVLCSPLGFLAIEFGWMVTELGRQPWIIFGIMKTREAVTPMPHLVYPMSLFTVVYVFLSFIVAWLMKRQFRNVA